MLSISSLIEFILKLLHDTDAQAEFARDPQGLLARNGLHNLSAQDVCDVAPMVADHETVHAKHDGPQSWPQHHDDPVRALSHIKENYGVHKDGMAESKHYNVTYVDHHDTIVNIDDRDTTSIQAQGDVTVKDSFNADNHVTVAQHSFNQDNDGVDNKDGSIDHGAVAGTSDPGHAASDPDPSKAEPSGSGTAGVDPSSHGTVGADPSSHSTVGAKPSDHGAAHLGSSSHGTAYPDSSGHGTADPDSPDPADHDFAGADASTVDPSEIDNHDPYDEHHGGIELHLAG